MARIKMNWDNALISDVNVPIIVFSQFIKQLKNSGNDSLFTYKTCLGKDVTPTSVAYTNGEATCVSHEGCFAIAFLEAVTKLKKDGIPIGIKL